MKTLRILALLPLLSLLSPALQAEEPKPEAPALPGGVEKLEPAMQDKLAKLMEAAVKFRGLKAKSTVPMGQLDKDGLKGKVVEMYAKEMPKDVLNPIERSLKVFALIPKDMDLAKYMPELMTSQIGGFYDPKQKYLVMVKQGKKAEVSPMEQKFGKQLADKMDEIVMVHEMTHSLQDQYFDLEKFHDEKTVTDDGAARLALIEGDATYVMYSYFYNKPLETLPMLEAVMETFTKNPDALMGAMPDMPGAKEMLSAPAYFRETLLFSYMQGMVFTIQVRKAGGQALFDYAFTTDPPRSTEQILHSDKWLGDRDDPVKLTFKDIPNAKVVAKGSWGEFSTRIVLRELCKNMPIKTELSDKADEAAAGWGGDAYEVLDANGKDIALWTTAWDTSKDAKEFHALIAQGLNDNARLEIDENAKRVFVVLGDATAEQKAEYLKVMRESPAEWPANKKIDLAQFKAKTDVAQDKKPALPSADDLKNAFGGMEDDENVQNLLKNKDISKLMESPEFQKMAEKMLGGKADGLNIGELMKNPMVKQMVEQMLKGGKDTPEGGFKDGVYTNPALGFSVNLPKGEGWKNEKPEPVGPLAQKPLVQFAKSDATGRANVAAIVQSLPMQLSIEAIGPMMEMGPQMMMQNFKKIGGGFVQSGAQKGFELEYTGDVNGTSVHVIQRAYIIDGKMMVVQGGTSVKEWDANAESIKGSLSSTDFKAKTPAETPPVKEEPKKEEPQRTKLQE